MNLKLLAGVAVAALGTAFYGKRARARVRDWLRVRRIERGAVIERTVNEAAQAGQRLVLAPAAVLTPLAKERARHLKVEIERERRC